MRVCVSERVCVCAEREKRAETEMDIVVRQRQERQEYQANKTNLT